MSIMDTWMLLGLGAASLLAWVCLVLFRGNYWSTDIVLDAVQPSVQSSWPSVCVVIPARNEADVLSETLPSLLKQTYPGTFKIVLVDDRSEDGTGTLARKIATEGGWADRLTVLEAEPLPTGWSGKLWALHQGLCAAESDNPEYWLLTDADIQHAPENLANLVSKATRDRLDLVSLMVRLRCESFWEVLLIPAFVYFFQKLYPFNWVNDPENSTAAAAGGCILVRREALARAGGIEAVRACLIDDCALAQRVKGSGGRLWLGLTQKTRSLRPYDSLADVWSMVARTAFTQLDYSPWLLLGTVVVMSVLYLLPPVAFFLGIGSLAGQGPSLAVLGLSAWLCMASTYVPTLRFYAQPLWLAFAMPFIALLYTAMTVDSALRHWRKEGGSWKGRVYPGATGE